MFELPDELGGALVPTQEKKISEMLGEYPGAHPKAKFWRFSVKSRKNQL